MTMLRAAIATCLLVAPLAPAEAHAAAPPAAVDPRPLDAALRDFARRTGLQLIYFTEATRDHIVGAVDESGTPQESLARLLAGTNLKFEFLNERTVGIRPRDTRGAASWRTASYSTVDPSGETRVGGARVDAAPSGETLADIVVTARKREERLIDVPIAVTAFGGEELARRGARSLADFLQEAPGVSVYSRAGSYKVAIRGISTSLGSNEIGYYLDELPFTGVTVPATPDVRAWDLERVEVLRGPQGTLFGEGSMGGTIRILTRDAQLGEWQGQVLVSGSDTASGGGTNEGYKALLNVPILDDRLALRLAGTKEEIDGWIVDAASGAERINTQDIETYRARLLFRPTEQLSIGASYWRYQGEFPRDNTADEDGNAGAGLALASETDYRLYGATLNYEFGPAAVFYSFADSRFEVPQTGALLGGSIEVSIGIDVRSHELRLSSAADGPLQWTLGAYRRDADRRDTTRFALFGIDNGSATDSRSEAIFGEATYSLPSVPVDLTLGLRSVREKLAGIESNAGVPTAPVDQTYRSTNPRLIVAWRPTDAWRVYASAAKGYRSGQLQPSVSLALAGVAGITLPPTLEDDSIWTYELGSKAEFGGGRAIVEGAVYRSEWEDVTVRIPIGTTGFNGLINSEGTTTNGVEASLTLLIGDAWRVNVMGSYADGEYAAAVPGTGIQKGEPLDDVSKTTAAASVDYRRTVFDDLEGTARIGAQYNSRRDFPSFGPPLFLPGDAITTVAARIGVEGDWWSAYLFVDNLTNEDGAMSPRNVTVPGVTPATANRPQPRTVGLEVRLGFGGR